MSVPIPEGLRGGFGDFDDGRAWLDAIPLLAARAVARWALELCEPYEAGMAAWTAPATTADGTEVVLKLSFPHPEARDEAAALRAWREAGAVEVLDDDADDWALLLRRLRPGTHLRDAGLPAREHLSVGVGLLARMAAVEVPEGPPFRSLVDEAHRLAATLAERTARLAPTAPIPIDVGLCRDAIDLLGSLPGDARRRGLVHGDLNPGNILRHDADDGSVAWCCIDPKPLHGDLAWDPWPLVTQLGDWTVTVADPAELAARARFVGDALDLDPARIAAWSVARGVESALWACNRGWWTGFRGADGDLARAAAWASAASRLGA